MAITGDIEYESENSQFEDDKEGGDDKEHSSFEIVEFLTENRDLFAVLGVFAALSVYIPRLASESGQSTVLNIGFASSVAIFMVVIYAICKEADKQYGVVSDIPSYMFEVDSGSFEELLFL